MLALRARAIVQNDREFFRARCFKVDTPLLSRFGVTDPNIELFTVASRNEKRFLQSSPEYANKRLLVSGIGDIFRWVRLSPRRKRRSA